MNQLIKSLPSEMEQEPWISLHDQRITKIDCGDNKVDFHFADGFNLIENGRIEKQKNGVLRFSECSEEDFCCRIIKDKYPVFRGKYITLKALNEKLVKTKSEIEIYIELYSNTFTYFRGTLTPRLTGGKRPPLTVVIETMDFFNMTYFWE